MNYVGKTLVFINLLLSAFFLAWAAAIYLQRADWGWKDPRKHLETELIPSEIDKRTALIKELLPIRDQATAAVDQGQKVLTYQQLRLAENHRWYNQKLAELQSAPGKLEIQQVMINKGVVTTDPQTFLPLWGAKVTFTDADKKTTDVDQSYDTYRGELNTVTDKIKTTQTDIQGWVAKQKALTVKLNGAEDEKGQLLRPGLYTLLSRENAIQEDLKRETNTLRPKWVRELVDAQLLLERQDSLRARLAELKAVVAARR